MTKDERKELADMLREAQSQLFEAIETLNYVADNSGERGSYWTHYLIAPIEIATTRESMWVSRDANIDDWIDSFESDDEDEDSDDSEEDNDVG